MPFFRRIETWLFFRSSEMRDLENIIEYSMNEQDSEDIQAKNEKQIQNCIRKRLFQLSNRVRRVTC